MLIVEVRIGPLAWCAVSGPPQRCWRRGGATPKHKPSSGRQIWWGCRFGKRPGNQEKANLACGEGVQRTLGGKTKGSKESRRGLKAKPAEQAKAWLILPEERVKRFPRERARKRARRSPQVRRSASSLKLPRLSGSWPMARPPPRHVTRGFAPLAAGEHVGRFSLFLLSFLKAHPLSRALGRRVVLARGAAPSRESKWEAWGLGGVAGGRCGGGSRGGEGRAGAGRGEGWGPGRAGVPAGSAARATGRCGSVTCP